MSRGKVNEEDWGGRVDVMSVVVEGAGDLLGEFFLTVGNGIWCVLECREYYVGSKVGTGAPLLGVLGFVGDHMLVLVQGGGYLA